ncbi:CD63 antigen-like [Limulus polyphemus]|uniref:Tetraspanin n=1 Tax=Limulus polyphemus TaxID=6850 RepID=A0ABM1B2B4_LIMPO|nr:CD63 antigen-like [Limulus polyphemus]
MASGGMAVIKFLLFAFNFLFLVSGIGLIVVGALSLKNITKYADFMVDNNTTSPTMLIIVGSIVFVLAFLGCCGAWKENYCMLMTFAVLLFIIFAVELAAGIAAYVYRKDVEKAIKEGMQDDLKKNATENDWDKIQTELKCCGAVNASDWSHQYPDGNLPPSCCDAKAENCTISDDNWHKQGCIEALKDFLEDKVYILGGVGVGIAFIQLLGITFACCLACDKDKRY